MQVPLATRAPTAWTLVLPLLFASARGAASENPAGCGESVAKMMIGMRTGDTEVQENRNCAGTRRWLEIDRTTTSGRYREIESDTARAARIGQVQLAFKGGVKLDEAGKFKIETGVYTGGGFTGGWNSIRSGDVATDLNVKQLFFAARPVHSLQIEVGGLDIAHGESTEVTSYDFDGYVTGQRLRFAPLRGFVDEVSVTVARLDALEPPSVFERLDGLSHPNYVQLLVHKKMAAGHAASAEITDESGETTLRQAVRLAMPTGSVIDWLQFENYERLGTDAGYGFGLYGQEQLSRRLTVGMGFTRIDRTGLNSDRFPRGKRLYGMAHLSLARATSLSFFLSRALGAPETTNRTRLDLALSYDFRRAAR